MTRVTDENFNPSGDYRIDEIKYRVNSLSGFIHRNIPEGRRRSVALTKLEDFSMWAVKAAACGDD